MARDVDRGGEADAPPAAVTPGRPDAEILLWEQFFPTAEADSCFAALLTTLAGRGG